MEKTIFEQMGGTYEQQGDYLTPLYSMFPMTVKLTSELVMRLQTNYKQYHNVYKRKTKKVS